MCMCVCVCVYVRACVFVVCGGAFELFRRVGLVDGVCWERWEREMVMEMV
jgi:hypothetical protein